MKQIFLLDCTLRDGGYINNWRFGRRAICNIGKKIVLSGVEYFEAGFVRDCVYDEDCTLFDGNESIVRVISPKSDSTKYVGMIDMARPISLTRLGERTADGFDVLRVIFKKNKTDEAYDYISKLISLGYEVFAQPVGTDLYTEEEFSRLTARFGSLDIAAFYIVDSFGVLKKKRFMEYVRIADEALREGVMLGYHSHNNMQQAMGNACAMTEYSFDRDIVIDACVFGMGRGAGNLNMELFAEYMNENFGKTYRIEPMLEIIDEYLNDIYRKHFWGYSLPFYLSAANSCHPDYASYFSKKGTLTSKSYDELLKSIPVEERSVFDAEKAEHYYQSYTESYINDSVAVEKLSEELSGKNILLLGPGKTLETERRKIETYINTCSPVIISLNFIPAGYLCDYVFSCHMRRYKYIEGNSSVKRIITSNLREAKEYDYMINLSSYKSKYDEILENSGLVCLNLLAHIGIRRVVIAGMDGYDIGSRGNYVSSGLEFDCTPERLELRNTLIGKEIAELRSRLDIEFLTTSMYR